MSKLIKVGAGYAIPTPYQLYTVPPGATTMLTEVLLSSNGDTCRVSLWIVPQGEELGNQHRVQNEIELLPGENRYITLALVMVAGERLYLAAPTGRPTYRVSALEDTP